MKKTNQRNLWITMGLFLTFVLWTAAVSCLDIQAIGPRGSKVGLAALNAFVHNLTGVHLRLYTLTDWLGLVPVVVVLGFAGLGLTQLIKRKSLLKVERSIWVLGGFYILLMVVYVFFECCIVNYRPILIDGCLEASYPSSTTLLVMCVMPTAILQIKERISNERLGKTAAFSMMVFTVLMVIGRLVSGVHWFTDIVGGILLSAALVMLYKTVDKWQR